MIEPYWEEVAALGAAFIMVLAVFIFGCAYSIWTKANYGDLIPARYHKRKAFNQIIYGFVLLVCFVFLFPLGRCVVRYPLPPKAEESRQ